jgi:hypothetical protein
MLCVTCNQTIPVGHVFVYEQETYCAIHSPKGSHRLSEADVGALAPRNEAIPNASSEPPSSEPSADTSGFRVIATFLLLGALAFVGYGINRLYTYDEIQDKIVGGDAYNYLIVTNRGVGLIAAGVCLAAVACAVLLFGLLSSQRRTRL